MSTSLGKTTFENLEDLRVQARIWERDFGWGGRCIVFMPRETH